MNWLKKWVILTTGRHFHIWYQKHGCYSSCMSSHAPHLSSSVGIPQFEHGVPAVKEFRSEELLLHDMRKNKPLPPQSSNNYWIKLCRNPQIRKQSSLRKQYGIFAAGSGAVNRWVADVLPRETSPAARNEGKRLFSQDTNNFIYIRIGNSKISTDIWHKYHEWYFKIVIRNFTSR